MSKKMGWHRRIFVPNWKTCMVCWAGGSNQYNTLQVKKNQGWVPHNKVQVVNSRNWQVLCLSLPSLIHGYGCIARHKHSFLSGAVNGPCSDVCYISKQQRFLWIDSTNPDVENWHQHSREKADKLKSGRKGQMSQQEPAWQEANLICLSLIRNSLSSMKETKETAIVNQELRSWKSIATQIKCWRWPFVAVCET